MFALEAVDFFTRYGSGWKPGVSDDPKPVNYGDHKRNHLAVDRLLTGNDLPAFRSAPKAAAPSLSGAEHWGR
jgi:hypothetical protein